MSAEDVDAKTLEAIVQMHRSDLADLKSQRNAKHLEGEISDFDVAIELLESQLEALTVADSDRAMCSSIAQAVGSDGEVLTSVMRNELQAARDDEVDEDLPEDGDHDNINGHLVPPAPLDEELLAKMEALYNATPFDVEAQDQAESSTPASTRPNVKQPKRVCISCGDEHFFFDVARCPCSHEYCRKCLEDLFKLSLTDESLFPPRCCMQIIPLENNRIFLPSKLVGEFNAKKLELETPNRTYCHEPTCSTFVPTQFIRDEVAICVRCNRRTCAICKAASHDGDCPQDPAVQELLSLADDMGWKRCYSCHRLVELDLGCNHMTCRCGAEFCYECGLVWKTCPCDQWQEDRLFARAEAIVDRDLGRDGAIVNVGRHEVGDRGGNETDDHVEPGGAPETDMLLMPIRPPVDREALIAAATQYLIENHECTHERWRNRGGPETCEECGDTMPIFIYECRQCRIMACRRCRYNRL